MKNLSISFLSCLVTGLFLFSSCLKNDDDFYDGAPQPSAFMTFVNAFPETDFLTYDLHGPNSPFQLQYQSYLRPVYGVQVGNRQLTVSGSTTLVDTLITVRDSSAYSTFVYGSGANARFAMTQDKAIEGLRDNSGIRFLNLANVSGNVNLIIGDGTTAAFADRPVETGSTAVQHQTFEAKTSGTQNLRITDADGNEIARRSNYSFQKGYYYTIFLTGNQSGGNKPLYIGVIYH